MSSVYAGCHLGMHLRRLRPAPGQYARLAPVAGNLYLVLRTVYVRLVWWGATSMPSVLNSTIPVVFVHSDDQIPTKSLNNEATKCVLPKCRGHSDVPNENPDEIRRLMLL